MYPQGYPYNMQYQGQPTMQQQPMPGMTPNMQMSGQQYPGMPPYQMQYPPNAMYPGLQPPMYPINYNYYW